MYAIVEIAGQQFKVEKDQQIFVHRLDAKTGSKISFDKVLLTDDNGKVSIGKPFLAKSTIEGVVKSQGRDKKVNIIKFHRRKHYKKQAGHRQSFTQVEITNIAEG